jgi:hypothetical protein
MDENGISNTARYPFRIINKPPLIVSHYQTRLSIGKGSKGWGFEASRTCKGCASDISETPCWGFVMMTPQAGTAGASPSCLGGARRIIGLCRHTFPAAFYQLSPIWVCLPLTHSQSLLSFALLDPIGIFGIPGHTLLDNVGQLYINYKLQSVEHMPWGLSGFIQAIQPFPRSIQKLLLVDVLRWKALTYKVPRFETLKKWLSWGVYRCLYKLVYYIYLCMIIYVYAILCF